MSPPRVSIIIAYRNAGHTVGKQLGALRSQTRPDHELLILDHGSTADHRAMLEPALAGFDNARIVDVADAVGLSQVRNRGILQAAGEIILFCDADDIVQPGWVAAMVAGLDQYDLVGGRFDEDTLNDPVVRSWRTSRPQQSLPRAFGFPYAVGGNMGVRADVARQVMFNETASAAATDVEFSWQVQQQGYRIGFLPDALIQYRYRDSMAALARQMYRYGVGGAQLARRIRAEDEASPLQRRTPRTAKAARIAAGLVAGIPGALVDRGRRGYLVGRLAAAAGWTVGTLRR